MRFRAHGDTHLKAQGMVYNTTKDNCMDLCQDTDWCHIAVSYPEDFL